MAEKMSNCYIVSGAPNDCSEFLKNKINNEDFVIAADSGYKHLLKAGIIPNVIVGDFDSSPRPDIDCKIVSLPCEKAYCDTYECVDYAINNGFNNITILNAIGSRFDHTYANVLLLNYCKNKKVNCCICNEKNRLSLITDRCVINKDYDNFSLFAFMENAQGVAINGAYYTAGFYDKDKLDFDLGDMFGVSNYVVDEFCEITIDKGTLLLIESND